LTSIAATVSLPNGMRNGGSGEAASVTSALASLGQIAGLGMAHLDGPLARVTPEETS
jgi:hypothetical protein